MLLMVFCEGQRKVEVQVLALRWAGLGLGMVICTCLGRCEG
jgi:hypothetical protein